MKIGYIDDKDKTHLFEITNRGYCSIIREHKTLQNYFNSLGVNFIGTVFEESN